MRKSFWGKRVLLLTVSLLSLALATIISLNTVNASVIPGDLMTIMNNGVSRLDPEGDDCISGEPDGSKVTWIGDSISVGAATQIKSKLSGVDIYAQTGKNFGKGSDAATEQGSPIIETNSGTPTGISILKWLIAEDNLRDYVVFALGTNGSSSVTADTIAAVKETIGDSRKLILVSNFKLGSDEEYEANNTAMATAAEGSKQIAVADWFTTASNMNQGSPPTNTYINDSDGINVHLTSTGSEVFVDTVYNALSSVWTGGGGGGIDTSKEFSGNIENADKIATSLANANFTAAEGGKLNAAQLAGLMINFWHEHSFDTSGDGFAQWLDNTCGDDIDCQIERVISELNEPSYSSPDGAWWNPNGNPGTTYGMKDFWTASGSDYTKAAQAIADAYERCSNSGDYIDACHNRGVPGKGWKGVLGDDYTALINNIYLRYVGLAGGGNICEVSGDFLDDETFVFYNQCDDRWGSLSYGNGTMCSASCGISAFAMAITAIQGKQVTPTDTREVMLSLNKSSGVPLSHNTTSEGFAPAMAKHYGINSEVIELSVESVNNALKQGKIVHLSGAGSSPFSRGGHYIIIRGVLPNGKWKIGDSGNSSNNYKEWDPQSEIAAAGWHYNPVALWR